MESSRYIDEVNCYHSAGFSFDYQINWIVPAITGSENANGYIVQHFTRLSQPKNSIVDDIEYFEAWRIKNGVCLDRGKCDDEFIQREVLRFRLRFIGYPNLAHSAKLLISGPIQQ